MKTKKKQHREATRPGFWLGGRKTRHGTHSNERAKSFLPECKKLREKKIMDPYLLSIDLNNHKFVQPGYSSNSIIEILKIQ